MAYQEYDPDTGDFGIMIDEKGKVEVLRETVKPLRGLEKLCKMHGRMKCGDVMMAWDYVNECALPEEELKADKERWAASEKVKWSCINLKP